MTQSLPVLARAVTAPSPTARSIRVLHDFFILQLGRHKFDIRFWREGERTEFEVLNGNASVVERCEVGVKAAQLRDRTEPI